MKKSLKHFFTALLNILGITSLTSCLGGGGGIFGGGECMYGVPCNSFTVTGVVTGDTDNDGQTEPVNGIKIKLLPISNSASSSEPSLNEDAYGVTTCENEKDGKFTVHYTCQIGEFGYDDLKFIVSFEDVDGEENGSFENKSVEVVFKDTPDDDSDTWTKNYTITDLKVQLTPKK